MLYGSDGTDLHAYVPSTRWLLLSVEEVYWVVLGSSTAVVRLFRTLPAILRMFWIALLSTESLYIYCAEHHQGYVACQHEDTLLARIVSRQNSDRLNIESFNGPEEAVVCLGCREDMRLNAHVFDKYSKEKKPSG
eukprot:scaffold152530_cov36-Prasinocladus_malaysianus.AAC.1